MTRVSYDDVRNKMKAGDVIAFGGSSHFSGIIKMAIRAEVSHIGILLKTQVENGHSKKPVNYIIDSTSRQGVAISWLFDRMNEYDGDVWWLPMREDIRKQVFNEQTFYEFLAKQEGKKYDRRQAAGSAIDMFDNVQLPFGLRGPGYNEEDYSKFFCSELVAAGLKTAGVIPENVNASEATPIDICRWNIYEPDYYLLKGEFKKISGYNCLDPHFCSTHTPVPTLNRAASC